MTTKSGAQLVSVITVTYNSAGFVGDALRSSEKAAAAAGVNLEMIVVDNASSDESTQLVRDGFPRARVIANDKNLGFATATNQGLKVAEGDAWLLLNPDASVEEEALVHLLGFLRRHPGAGAVAPVVDTPWSGGPECAGMSPGIRSMVGHYLMVNRLLWKDRGGPWRGVMLQPRRWLGPRRADWLGAAVMLIKPEAMASVGGFDESYFLYSEDVDLGERLTAAGWELWIVPAAVATHLVAGGKVSTSVGWVEAAHDHYARRASWPLLVAYDWVLAGGLSVRAVAWRLLDRSEAGSGRAQMVAASARQAWIIAFRTLIRPARCQGS